MSKGRGARALLVAAAVALPAEIAVVRGSRVLLGGVPGAYLPFGDQVLVLLASLSRRPRCWDSPSGGLPSRPPGAEARSPALVRGGERRRLPGAPRRRTAGFMAGVQTFTVAW